MRPSLRAHGLGARVQAGPDALKSFREMPLCRAQPAPLYLADLLEPRLLERGPSHILKALELLSLLPAALCGLRVGQKDQLRGGRPSPCGDFPPPVTQYQGLGESEATNVCTCACMGGWG